MKKILLATTVLAASAGFAAAEVSVGGSARMGIISIAGGDAEFTSRVRINFNATGETDGGLSFGASVRNDQSGVGNTANGDSTVFISGAFGKITMGDAGNAPDALVGQVSGVGLTGLKDANEIDFLSTPKTGALYTYSAGALSFGLGLAQTTSDEATQSIAVKYSTDAYSVAIGYENAGAVAAKPAVPATPGNVGSAAIAAAPAATQLSISASATFSGATVKAKVADLSTDSKLAYALSVDYAMSGANVTAFYSDNAKHNGKAAYGLGASYDLGGGASVVGGISKTEGSKASFDLGVSMSF